jgi:HEPN domain-containing protein
MRRALGEYWVTFDVLETEAQHLEDATVSADDRVGGVVTQEPSDGTASVVFQLVAYDQDGAWREAEEVYEKLRRDAGLENAPSLGGSVTRLRDAPVPVPTPPKPRPSHTPVVPPPQPYEPQLEKARTLFDLGEYEHATIAAQGACETVMAQSLRSLIAVHASSLQKALEGFISRQFSLSQGRMCDLWGALAGDDIRQAEFWKRYREHLTRRNSVIHHEGSSVSREQAEESMVVAREFCDYVTKFAP